jgi:hypothetical protein
MCIYQKYWSQSRQSTKLFVQSSELGLPKPLNRRRVCPPPLWYSIYSIYVLCDSGASSYQIPASGRQATAVLASHLATAILSLNKNDI